MENTPCKVKLFIDDNPHPIAEMETPIEFELDTTKLVDGDHTLKIVSAGKNGKEGIRKINFVVRNGPAIDFEGLKEKQIVDGILPLMVNSYDKDVEQFNITGSETPKSVPTWMWIMLILFIAWAMFYFVTYVDIPDFVRPK